MIIQNGQPRNYAICNGRKVGMLRGGQWIKEPFQVLLSPAVKSQIYADILDASLAYEVWRAANAYCKAHKQAHPELTAQGKLLSTFVNNDPDMYASLPITATPAALSALPKRLLSIGNTSSYFTTTFTPQVGDIFEYGVWINGNSDNMLFGTAKWDRGGIVLNLYRDGFQFIFHTSLGNRFNVYDRSQFQEHILTANIGSQTITSNGSVIAEWNGTSTPTFAPLTIMSAYGDYSATQVKLAYLRVKRNGVYVANFIPNINNNVKGLLDIEPLTFVTKQGGSFTIEKS